MRVVGVDTPVAGIGVGLAIPINATSRRIISTPLADGRVRLSRRRRRAHRTHHRLIS
ncbi:hypothetical protein [Nocardia thraciensis]